MSSGVRRVGLPGGTGRRYVPPPLLCTIIGHNQSNRNPLMHIRYEIDGHTGIITFANPPYNTLTDPAFEDPARLQSFFDTPSLKAVLVRGEGRHFCGGADLEAIRAQAAAPEAFAERLNAGKALLEQIACAPLPVVAAIRGSCLGAGLEIALACHFRVAAESALLGFPETGHQLIPGFGGTLAGDSVPRRELIGLVLSAEMIRGDEALGRGLVDRCCAASQVEQTARALLDSMVARRPVRVIRAAMESLANGRRLSRHDALLRETELFCTLARVAPEET
ncbi:MAG: hypothetical protein GF331_04030 [Chitinivibrionales bacterium]|nr:hypothetical protein [Chitinivibrionales bacterium]